MTATTDRLQDLEIAITGRLASMSRRDAIDRIREAGGTFVEMPRATTSLLVVGRDGPPIDGSGRITRKLARAHDLCGEGASLEIVDEDELLQRLGIGGGSESLYTTAQLARILGVPGTRIRTWLRHGLIEPRRVERRLAFFDFRQVASARALSALAEQGVPARRMRESLEQLRGWLPGAEAALAQAEVLERGALLVRTDDGSLAETTGQMRIEFGVREAAMPALVPTGPVGVEALFEDGIVREEAGDLDGAVHAYERALEAGGKERPEIPFNLGNALYGLDRKAEAARRYWQATELDAEYVEAWNNLGNALADLGETVEAIKAFEHALRAQPDYADAHFNLAELLATTGEIDRAREHWTAYLGLDQTSAWANEVRLRLERSAAPTIPLRRRNDG